MFIYTYRFPNTLLLLPSVPGIVQPCTHWLPPNLQVCEYWSPYTDPFVEMWVLQLCAPILLFASAPHGTIETMRNAPLTSLLCCASLAGWSLLPNPAQELQGNAWQCPRKVTAHSASKEGSKAPNSGYRLSYLNTASQVDIFASKVSWQFPCYC